MTGATKAKFTLSGITVATNGAQYALTVNGITYDSTTTNVDVADLTALEAHIDSSAFTDSNGNQLNALYDIAVSGSTITITAKATGDYGVSSALSVTGGDSTGFVGGSVAVTNAGGTGIKVIDAALDTIATNRATLGATQAQLESTVRNLANVAENTAAAQGRIMDTDYAAETANLTKAQILQQAATSILAQANAQPESVLSLLQ